jgi:hypothetical protein
MSNDVKQFLVGPRTSDKAGQEGLQGQEDLQRFAEKVDATANAAIVRKGPSRLVVAMPPKVAEKFRGEFQNLIIEEDAALTL